MTHQLLKWKQVTVIPNPHILRKYKKKQMEILHIVPRGLQKPGDPAIRELVFRMKKTTQGNTKSTWILIWRDQVTWNTGFKKELHRKHLVKDCIIAKTTLLSDRAIFWGRKEWISVQALAVSLYPSRIEHWMMTSDLTSLINKISTSFSKSVNSATFYLFQYSNSWCRLFLSQNTKGV